MVLTISLFIVGIVNISLMKKTCEFSQKNAPPQTEACQLLNYFKW